MLSIPGMFLIPPTHPPVLPPRSMTFKAMPLPEPAKVFSPDRTKGAKVTQSIDFTFRTEERAKAHGGAN